MTFSNHHVYFCGLITAEAFFWKLFLLAWTWSLIIVVETWWHLMQFSICDPWRWPSQLSSSLCVGVKYTHPHPYRCISAPVWNWIILNSKDGVELEPLSDSWRSAFCLTSCVCSLVFPACPLVFPAWPQPLKHWELNRHHLFMAKWRHGWTPTFGVPKRLIPPAWKTHHIDLSWIELNFYEWQWWNPCFRIK